MTAVRKRVDLPKEGGENEEVWKPPEVDMQRIEKRFTGALLRMRLRSPFFATLALFAKRVPSWNIPTAATDGMNILYNPKYMEELKTEEFDAVLLHEVLHAALLHVFRRGHREGLRWNYAADISVNGMISHQSGAAPLKLPEGHLRDTELEDKRVEEIYELLGDSEVPESFQASGLADLLDPAAESGATPGKDGQQCGQPSSNGMTWKEWEKACKKYWQQQVEKAKAIYRMSGQGSLPAGLGRAFGEVTSPSIDWKAQLWRFLVRTPTDFCGFDRRFYHRGVYLDALDGFSVTVFVCIDTSGSIGAHELKLFYSELLGILNAYPHIKCKLYYADADVYGPFELGSQSAIPDPVGGGGTDFRPFFDKIKEEELIDGEAACVYLTDGYGSFPTLADLEYPVLWVLTPGGIEEEEVPVGEAVKLLPSS